MLFPDPVARGVRVQSFGANLQREHRRKLIAPSTKDLQGSINKVDPPQLLQQFIATDEDVCGSMMFHPELLAAFVPESVTTRNHINACGCLWMHGCMC